jgi:hypothetical protein
MSIRFVYTLAVAVLTALLLAAAAQGSPRLSERAAVRALRADLSHSYGIKHVHATCRRKSGAKFSCSWRGRRSDGGYRGRAIVSRASGTTSVSLSQVRKV